MSSSVKSISKLEEVCSRCRTSNFQNRSLRLLVNECGHDLCEKCVEHLFIRGSAACPTCKTVLKKSGYKEKRFEDNFVEKEVDVRKRILKDYNKTEGDFNSLRDFNDYLEEIEDIVFNFVYNVNVEETKAKVERYKRDNFKIIQRNRIQQSRNDAYLKAQLLAEEREQEEIRLRDKTMELMDEIEKTKRKKKLIDQIANSDRPADEIIMLHEEEENIQSSLSNKKANNGFNIAMIKSLPKSAKKSFVYKYEEPGENTKGPKLDISTLSLDSVDVGEVALASGYIPLYKVQRQIDHAYSGLFIFR